MGAGTGLKLSSNLVKDFKDWKLTGTLTNLTVQNLLEKFNVEVADLFIPSYFPLNKGFNTAKIVITPSSGIELKATTGVGVVDVLVKYLDSVGVIKPPLSTQLTLVKPGPPKKLEKKKGWGICAGFSFSPEFTFKSLAPELGFLDKYAQLDNKGIYFSTFNANPGLLLPVFKYMGNGTTFYKGVTFIFGTDVTKMNLGPVLGKLSSRTGVDYLVFQANIPVNPTNITVDAAMVFDKKLNIAHRIFFKNIDLLLEANNGDPKFSIAAIVDVNAPDKQTLQFLFKGSLEPFNQTVSVGGAMLNTWKNVFGFPNLDIGNLELGLGVTFSADEIPIPDDLSIAGKFNIGGIAAKGRIMFDANQLERNVFIAGVDNITWNNILGTFCTHEIVSNIPSYVSPLFESKLNHANIKLAPPGGGPIRTLTGELIEPGFRISGDGEISGWHGQFTLDLEGTLANLSAGLLVTGKMDPIKIDADNLKVFYFTAAKGKEGPEMKFDLSTERILKIASGQGAAKDTINYINAGVTLLDINKADAFLLLTPKGYECHLNGKLFGSVEGSLDAVIAKFSNPLVNTHVNAKVDTRALYNLIKRDLLNELSRIGIPQAKFLFELKKVSFAGNLEALKSSVTFKVNYSFMGDNNKIDVTVNVKDVVNLAKFIADQIKSTSNVALRRIKAAMDRAAQEAKAAAERAAAEARATAQRSAAELRNAAEKSTASFRTASSSAANEGVALKNKLANAAPGVFNNTKNGLAGASQKTEQFFKDFGNFSKNTAGKIFHKSIDQLHNGWDDFTKDMKKAFTGGDNEERLLLNGPAFRITAKYPNKFLRSPSTSKKNFPVELGTQPNWAEETWQLYPADIEGTFYLVSGYSGLLVSKARKDYCTLIPHESDHKDRERMQMEQVPGEAGWYYLKYKDTDKGYTIYLEFRNVSVNGSQKWVLVPVSGNPRTSEAKFKFEEVAQIDWKARKGFPPVINFMPSLVNGNRYQFEGTGKQFLYSNGIFRWIPDMETLTGMKLDSRPLTFLQNTQRLGLTFGTPLPSWKDGSLFRSVNDPTVFIMNNGTRRWIPDMETFNMMNLNESMVQWISNEDLNGIPISAQIPSKFIAKPPLAERVLYQVPGNPKVYIIINNTFRGIPDPETLGAMGYNFGMVNKITSQDLSSKAVGPGLATRKDNSLVKAENEQAVYIMDRGMRRWIPDYETFAKMKLDENRIQKVSKQDLLDIPAGPNMPSLK